MKTYDVIVERDSDTGLLVGYVPGWPGAHSQGAGMDELQNNLQEVLEMLLEEGEPQFESELVGVHKVQVA
jgi:predicted RNase H-like HicB family nuclease